MTLIEKGLPQIVSVDQELTENDFLNQWMEFELNLKNLMLVMSNRKQELPFSEIILEANEMAALMKGNPAADFSTQTSIDFLNQVEQIIETENRINFLTGRFPVPIQRNSMTFITLPTDSIQAGVPSQLLSNRPDIRQSEMELAATKLDVKVARANFYPS